MNSRVILATLVALVLVQQISAQDFAPFCTKINAANVPSFMKCLTDFVPANMLGFMMECQQEVRPGDIMEFVISACADRSLLTQWTQCQVAKLGNIQMTDADMKSMESLVGCVMSL